MLRPPSEVIASPAVRPACAAAGPGPTPATSAPAPPGNPGAPDEVTATPRKAVAPMWTAAEDLPASIWLAMETASLIGTVKAWVVVAELSWLPPDDAAVFRPITWP